LTTLKWGSATDVGAVRESNQDSLLTADPLFAVADGMGGHQGGEVASATALEVLNDTFTNANAAADGATTKADLLEAVRRANAKVWDKAQLDDTLHGMGTTLTAAALVTDDEDDQQRVAVVNVGDSRTYLIRGDEMRQLTLDHSFVAEMVRAGELSPDEAETHPKRNIVTRALGVEPTVQVDIEMLEPKPGDRLLLCSDGLIRELTDDQVFAVSRRLRNPDEAAHELVAQAKAHGGHDNITVVIVDVEDDGETPVTIDPKKTEKPKKTKPAKAPRATRLTLRVVLFVTLIVALIAIACGSVVWYARASYYVGVEGQQLVIYRGRPQPVLWFKATVAERTTVNTSQILPGDLPRVQAGQTETSLQAAEQFVQNLTAEAAQAQQSQVTTTTTVPKASSTKTRKS
jgi:PPM family protein phosphatase